MAAAARHPDRKLGLQGLSVPSSLCGQGVVTETVTGVHVAGIWSDERTSNSTSGRAVPI